MDFSKYIIKALSVFLVLPLFSCEEEFAPNSSYFSPIQQKTIVYTGEKAGDFETMASNIDWQSVEKLTVKGHINHNDLHIIKKYASNLYGNLKVLDFKDTDILEGAFPDRLFEKNQQIERFVYPRKIMATGDFIFFRCFTLKEVVIPEEVEILGAGTLSDVDKAKLDANQKLYYDTPMPKAYYTIPDMVKELGELCYNHYPYKSIDIPDSVEKLGNSCFANAKLGSFRFPPKVTVVEQGLFGGCKNLKTVKLNNKITTINKVAFKESGIEELIMPASVTRVGKSFVAYTPNLKKIQWSPNITNLEEKTLAFIHLEEFHVPKTVKKLGRLCFMGATTKRYYLHEDINELGEGLFNNNENDTTNHIEELHVKWQTPPPAGKTFNTAVDFAIATFIYPAPDFSKVTLYVPKGTKTAYQNAEGWKKFGIIIEE